MKKFLIELEHLPEEGKFFEDELDSEIFGIDDEELISTGPLSFSLKVQRFEGELFVQGKISAPFQFRCVRCLDMFDFVIVNEQFSTSIEIDGRSAVDLTEVLREEIVIDFPAYPKCADSGEENACMAKTSHFGLDKKGQKGVNSSAPNDQGGVWDALEGFGKNQ